MQYLYNPVTGELDDIETPKLGEKYFASAETDEIIKTINDQFGPGTMFPASEAPQPQNPYKDFSDRNPAAHGGRIGYKFGSPQSMAIQYGVKKTILPALELMGVTLSAARLAEIATENPTLLNKAAAYISSIPGKLEESDQKTKDALRNLFKDEDVDIDSEKQEIIERIEKVESDRKEPDQEPPKYTSKDALRDLKTANEFRKFFKKKEEEIQNTPRRYRREKFDDEYLTAFENYKNKFFGGNIRAASSSLDDLLELGDTSFRGRIRKDKIPEGIITQVLSGQIEPTESVLDIEASTGTYKTATNLIKENPKLVTEKVKTLIEEGALEGNEYYNLKTLADIFGIDKTNEYAVQTLGTSLKNLGVLSKKDTGQNRSERYFRLQDAVTKLTKWSKDKTVHGEGGTAAGKRYELEKKEDHPLTKLLNRFNKQLRKISLDTGVYQKWAHEDRGHSISIKLANKYKNLLKGSNINNLQTFVFQDPVVNQKILMEGGFENNYYEIFDQLKKFNNKKITEKDREKLLTIKTSMDNNYTSIMEAIYDRQQDKKTGSYFIGQEKRVPKISLKVPNVGETFTGSHLWADMSKVDLDFQIGNISKINKKAKKYEDLNEKEQSLYKENLKNQYLDNLEKYYTHFGYTAGEISDLLETFETGTAHTIGIPELAHGGLTGVIPDPGIMKYADGGRVNYEDGSPKGPNEPEGDDFLNKLEFNFNNIDDVTIDDTPITFDDSKSKLAQVADLADPRNLPYYGDMATQAALRIGEFGARIIPATGELAADLIRKPLFKTPSSYERTENYANMVDDTEAPGEKQEGAKFVGGPIFTNFLENITPTSTEKLVGLDTMINEEKKKMIARGSSSMPVKVGETAALGAELVAPIFPGLKLLKAFASAKGVKPTKEVAKTMEKEIDQMAAAKGMTRREFLTATGAVGTIALAKMLGIAGELPKIAKVTEAVTSVAKNADGVPEYLYNLKNVLRLRGELQPSSSAFLDGQEVYSYKGITLYHNTYPKDGSFRIAKEFETNSTVPGEPSYNKVEMEVNKGGDVVVDEGLETQKVAKVGDEYEEATAYPAREGGEDVDFYVDDEWHKQLEEISKELEEIDHNIEVFGFDKSLAKKAGKYND